MSFVATACFLKATGSLLDDTWYLHQTTSAPTQSFYSWSRNVCIQISPIFIKIEFIRFIKIKTSFKKILWEYCVIDSFQCFACSLFNLLSTSITVTVYITKKEIPQRSLTCFRAIAKTQAIRPWQSALVHQPQLPNTNFQYRRDTFALAKSTQPSFKGLFWVIRWKEMLMLMRVLRS